MRLSEAEYEKLCARMGKKYEAPNNKEKSYERIERESNEKIWIKRREKREFAKIGDTESLIIEGKLPGLNEIIAASKKHPYSYSIMKSKYSEMVMLLAMEQIKYNYNYVDINTLWIEPNKKRDKDNIVAGAKFILDGLVDAAIITGDGWRQINDLNHKYDVDSKQPRIIVSLTEIVGSGSYEHN